MIVLVELISNDSTYLFRLGLGISVGLVLSAAVSLWWYESATIRVSSDRIVINHFLRRPVSVRRHDIVRIVRCGVVQSQVVGTPPQPVVFMFGADGRCLGSLWMTRWGWHDLERIWRPLGLTVEGSWDDAIVQDQLASRFPGAF